MVKNQDGLIHPQSFLIGDALCSYTLKEGKCEICLTGEVTRQGNVVFREEISFSPALSQQVLDFVQCLGESRTHPFVMCELAEEFFS